MCGGGLEMDAPRVFPGKWFRVSVSAALRGNNGPRPGGGLNRNDLDSNKLTICESEIISV
jgi:hypothetical protein